MIVRTRGHGGVYGGVLSLCLGRQIEQQQKHKNKTWCGLRWQQEFGTRSYELIANQTSVDCRINLSMKYAIYKKDTQGRVLPNGLGFKSMF
jgi:hypothetical protein